MLEMTINTSMIVKILFAVMNSFCALFADNLHASCLPSHKRAGGSAVFQDLAQDLVT